MKYKTKQLGGEYFAILNTFTIDTNKSDLSKNYDREADIRQIIK